MAVVASSRPPLDATVRGECIAQRTRRGFLSHGCRRAGSTPRPVSIRPRAVHTSKPTQAFIVVFGDRHPHPKIVDGPDQELANPLLLGGLTVPVVVVIFEVDYPSKALENDKKRLKSGRA